MDEKTIARFWSKVDVRGPDECWEWLAYRDSAGYGRTRWSGQPGQLAHRASFQLTTGELAPVVRHRCDNRGCCNPSHLEPGTQADNVRDCVERGRLADTKGASNGRAALTEGDVLAIRATTAKGRYSAVAREYGVTPQLIRMVVLRLVWRHI